jgi:hypothetical protein
LSQTVGCGLCGSDEWVVGGEKCSTCGADVCVMCSVNCDLCEDIICERCVIRVTRAHLYACEKCLKDKIAGAGSKKVVGATVLIRSDSVEIEGLDPERGETVRLVVAPSPCWRGRGGQAAYMGTVLVEKAIGNECGVARGEG